MISWKLQEVRRRGGFVRGKQSYEERVCDTLDNDRASNHDERVLSDELHIWNKIKFSLVHRGQNVRKI